MNYSGISKISIVDGPGVRVVLWVSGCRCKCPGCHNKELWDFDYGKEFDLEAKTKLRDALSKPYIQGLTISGGHPLEPENCTDSFYWFLKNIKRDFPDKDIWLYTGWKWESICYHDIAWDIVRECIDVVVDGPYIEELRDTTLPFRGSSNQRLIDVKKSIESQMAVLWNE